MRRWRSWWRLKRAKRGPWNGEKVRFSRKLRRLIDCLIAAYIHWREECTALEEAYRRWVSTDGFEAELAFADYRERLDREERASIQYAELVRRVNNALPGGLAPEPAIAVATPRA